MGFFYHRAAFVVGAEIPPTPLYERGAFSPFENHVAVSPLCKGGTKGGFPYSSASLVLGARA
jgi:hypothetical protein